MFDKAEAEYRELSEKKRIVENDKDKIRKVSSDSVMRFAILLIRSGPVVLEQNCSVENDRSM